MFVAVARLFREGCEQLGDAVCWRCVRVDLQEQRFCDVEEVRRLQTSGEENAAQQGKLLLTYMLTRVDKEMARRSVKDARSLILLKDWDKERSNFSFRYWEEDFYGYIKELSQRDKSGEIEWLAQGKGLHARDRRRQDKAGKNVRLLRMHYKHNQIFTDHDIPKDAIVIQFPVSPYSLEKLHEIFELVAGKAGLPPDVTVQTERSLEKESSTGE